MPSDSGVRKRHVRTAAKRKVTFPILSRRRFINNQTLDFHRQSITRRPTCET